MALSLVLLIGAGLMLKSFLLLTSVNLGFQPDNVLTFWTSFSGANYAHSDRRASFYQQTLDTDSRRARRGSGGAREFPAP